MTSDRKHIIALLILFCLLSAPFLFKPFHNDEPLCVWIAQQITNHPLDFYGFQLNWEGHLQPVSQFYENPPLFSDFLALASRLVGWTEPGLRMAIVPINLISIVGSFLLSKQFCSRPGLVVLSLFCCPAYFLSCNTLMCEPLSICCWIWAVYFWFRGLFPASGLLVGLAILSKYSSICLLPLLSGAMAIYPASVKVRWTQISSLLIPIIFLISYEAWTDHLYGSGAFLTALGYASNAKVIAHTALIIRVINTVAFVGGGIAGVAIIALQLLRRTILVGGAVVIFAMALFASEYFQPLPGWANSSPLAFFTQYAILFGLGIGLVISSIKSLVKAMHRRDWRNELFLCLWIGGVFVFTACFNWAINARSILPMVLPVSILIIRYLDSLERYPGGRVNAGLIFTGILTLSVTAADDRLACTCRLAANELAKIARSRVEVVIGPPDFWFAGHSGFQYYMEAAGGRALDATGSQLVPGQIAIFPLNSYGASPGGTDFKFLSRYDAGPGTWLSTMQSSMGAGFYCSYGYALPFVFGPIPAESFTILQLTAKTQLKK